MNFLERAERAIKRAAAPGPSGPPRHMVVMGGNADPESFDAQVEWAMLQTYTEGDGFEPPRRLKDL